MQKGGSPSFYNLQSLCKGVDRRPVALAAFKAVCEARFCASQVGSTPTRSRQTCMEMGRVFLLWLLLSLMIPNESVKSKDLSKKKQFPRMRTGIGKKERAPGEVKRYTPEEIDTFLKTRGGKLQDSDAEV